MIARRVPRGLRLVPTAGHGNESDPRPTRGVTPWTMVTARFWLNTFASCVARPTMPATVSAAPATASTTPPTRIEVSFDVQARATSPDDVDDVLQGVVSRPSRPWLVSRPAKVGAGSPRKKKPMMPQTRKRAPRTSRVTCRAGKRAGARRCRAEHGGRPGQSCFTLIGRRRAGRSAVEAFPKSSRVRSSSREMCICDTPMTSAIWLACGCRKSA